MGKQLSTLDNTLRSVKKWMTENNHKIEGMTEFMISELFSSFENVKKDNTTLVAIDLCKIQRAMLEEGMRKSMTTSIPARINETGVKKLFSMKTKDLFY